MLGSTDRESVTDESGSLGPIFEGQALQDGANAHANRMWVHRVSKDTDSYKCAPNVIFK